MTSSQTRSQSEIQRARHLLSEIASDPKPSIVGYIASLCLQYNDPFDFWRDTPVSGFVDPDQIKLELYETSKLAWTFGDEINSLSPGPLGQQHVPTEFEHYHTCAVSANKLKSILNVAQDRRYPD